MMLLTLVRVYRGKNAMSNGNYKPPKQVHFQPASTFAAQNLDPIAPGRRISIAHGGLSNL
jgi:hypothetical protein